MKKTAKKMDMVYIYTPKISITNIFNQCEEVTLIFLFPRKLRILKSFNIFVG